MPMNARLLRPTASGFNPRQISGLALWLDAADSASLYTTSEGPVAPVSSPLDITGCVGWWDASDASTFTLDGSGNVEAWADKTSQGNDLTQATAENRPSVTAAAVNGLPAVTFDGSNDTLRTGAISLTQPFQYYLVFRFESAYTSGAPRIIDAGTQPSPGRAGEFFRQNTNDVRLYSGSTVTAGSVPAGQLEQFNLWSISSGGASDSFIRYKGGEYQVSTTAGTLDGSRITLGGDSNATASSHSNISVAELVLVSGALSAAERASLERYFAIKYGFDTVHAPATSASQPVGYWADKSGNGRHATQATGVNRCALGLTADFGGTEMKGRPLAVRALQQGVRNNLDIPGMASAITSGAATAVFAYRVVGANTFGTDNSYALMKTRNNFTFTQSSGSTREGMFRTTALTSTATAAVPRQGHEATVYSVRSSASEYVLRSKAAAFIQTAGNFNAGDNFSLFNDAALTMGAFEGDIGEVIIYDRALSDADLLRVERYLAAKWGITLAPQVSNADAQDWVNRVYANGGTVSASTATAVNSFCDAIDAAGIRDRFYRLNLFAGTGLNAALVPLYRGPKRGDGRNLLSASQELNSSAWTKDSVSVTADSVVAPDGTTTADVMTEDGTTNSHRVYQTFTAAANTSVAISCYAKRTSGTRNINIRAQAGADHIQATFDLAAGTATTAQGGTGAVTSAAATADGDWWRLTLVGKPSTSSANPSLSVYLHNGAGTYYTGDSSSAVAVWGVQAEIGTAATGYNGSLYGNTTDTNVGPFVSGDYVETGASGGLTGNGTSKYLNTGLSLDGMGFFLTGHLAVYHTQPTGSNVNRAFIGANNTSNGSRNYIVSDIFSSSAVSAFYSWVQSAHQTGLGSQVGGPAGHRVLSRPSSSSMTHYLSGVSLATNTTSIVGGAVSHANAFSVFARNNNGTVQDFNNCRIMSYSIGDGMTSQQVEAYYAAMQTFQTALGRNV